MNTKEFFETILPSEGVVLIVTAEGTGFKHRGFTNIDDAAAFAADADARGVTTYHACAAYQRLPFVNEDGKYVARTQSNWLSAKAFWCDVDCGEAKAAEGKGYATQLDAAKALLQWCKDKELPYPMLVSSGRGIHAYWCLTEAVDPKTWVQGASILKSVMEASGLHIDPSRTADFSSILRPVGTHNRKDPANPLPVQMVRAQKERIEPFDFIAKLMNIFAATPGTGELPPPPSWLDSSDAESMPIPDVPLDFDIELVANKCRQVGMMRDTQGDVGYDHWRGVIGLIKHAGAGYEKAVTWSAKRGETGHANTDVQTRWDTWNSPPPTCAFFQKCNPEGCEGCPFAGKVKTPASLGRKEPEPQTQVTEVVMEDDARKTAVTIEIPEFPRGYEWNGKTMIRYVANKDGVLEAHGFCHTQFYLIERIRNALGQYEFTVRAHLPQGAVREFKLPGEVVGAGGNKLFATLGSYEVYTSNSNNSGIHMGAYIKDSINKLMQSVDVVCTHTSYGWQENGAFLLGSRLYYPDGSITEALLNGYASDKRSCFPRPKGTLEGYADQMNWLYNRAGMEPLQYLICSLWAAPLVEFCEPLYKGIPCAVTGACSGKGKTTAAIAALYAFGDAAELTLFGDKGSTLNARSALLGSMRSLPLLFDEVTNMEPKALSQLAYALSNGTEAMRLQATGGRVRFSNRESWRLQAAMTGNAHIAARLSQAGNTEAEAMRIFEIRIDDYAIPVLDPVAVSTAIATLEQNMGCAGEAYIQYLVTQRKDVQRFLLDTFDWIKDDPILAKEPKYRFFRNHMACTLTAARLMKALKVIDFDLDKLRNFAVQAARRLLTETNELNSFDPRTALERMVAEFSPRLITTPTYMVKSNEPVYRVQASPMGIVGRVIRSTPAQQDKYDGQMMLLAGAVRDWCTDNRVDMDLFATELKKLGVLKECKRRSLGRDTTVTMPQARCWILDMFAVENATVEDNDSQGDDNAKEAH